MIYMLLLMAVRFTKPKQFTKGIEVKNGKGLCVWIIRWKKIIGYPKSN